MKNIYVLIFSSLFCNKENIETNNFYQQQLIPVLFLIQNVIIEIFL